MPDVTYADRTITFENFDPNQEFAQKPLWGVFDGQRFRTYTQRGHAINGVHHHARAKLYEQTGDGWVLRAAKDERNRPEVCSNCGGSTMGPYTRMRWDGNSYSYRPVIVNPNASVNNGEYVFRRHGRKMVEPIEILFVCQACKPVVDP